MKIDEFYRDAGKMSLNASLASLLPAVLIVITNLFIFHHGIIMFWTIPFLIYSIVNFQVYLWRIKLSNGIWKALQRSGSVYDSLFQAEQLLVIPENNQMKRLLIYFPDGHLAGEIKRYQARGIGVFRTNQTFILNNGNGSLMGSYLVKGKQPLTIQVFDQNNEYIGCFERKKYSFLHEKKELLNKQGRFVGSVTGASLYMDEHLLDSHSREVGRLRCGWMPLEWSRIFPNPNTPVFTQKGSLSEQDKLRQISYLIYEYFMER